MANGRLRTLDEFGWNESQTSAVQRAKVLDALDSGEPLAAPSHETVTTDETLLMGNCRRLIGDGSSTFHTDEISANILQTQDDNVKIAGINFTGGPNRTGSAVQIGPKPTAGGDYYAIYNVVEDCNTDYNHRYGVHVRLGGGFTSRGGFLRGRDGGLYSDNDAAPPLLELAKTTDAGDSMVYGTHLAASEAVEDLGAAFLWRGGGGWLFGAGGKCVLSKYHMRIESYRGQTGTLGVSNWSMEGNTICSVSMVGNQRFKRASFQAVNWGVFSSAFGSSGTGQWLERLILKDCLIEGGQNGSIPVYVDNTLHAQVGPLSIMNDGPSYPDFGIVIGSNAVGTLLNAGGSLVTGCSAKYANNGQATTIL